MKKNIILLFILSIIIPINTYAYELSCDEGPFTYGKSFTCKIKGDTGDYDKLSGSLEYDNTLVCGITNISEGLENKSKDNKKFEITGTPANSDLIKISCRVNEKLENEKNVTVSVPNFESHIKNSGLDVNIETLRSDYIKIGPYINQEGKPRNVSNPDLRLKTLSSEGLDLTFSQFITEYRMEVLYELEELNLKYDTVNPESTVEIKGDPKLIIGDNVIDIYVTSPDGLSKSCYTLVLTRLPRGQAVYYKEKDSTLSSLKIANHNIKFESIITEYKIHIDRDTDELYIKATPTIKNASVEIENNEKLKNGSVVTVTVKSVDETSTTIYKINIEKDPPKKDYTTIIIIAVFTIAIVGTIVLILKTNSSKKSDVEVITDILNKTSIGKKKKENKIDENIQEEQEIQEIAENQQVNTLNLNEANIVTPTPVEQVQNNTQVVNNPPVENNEVALVQIENVAQPVQQNVSNTEQIEQQVPIQNSQNNIN